MGCQEGEIHLVVPAAGFNFIQIIVYILRVLVDVAFLRRAREQAGRLRYRKVKTSQRRVVKICHPVAIPNLRNCIAFVVDIRSGKLCEMLSGRCGFAADTIICLSFLKNRYYAVLYKNSPFQMNSKRAAQYSEILWIHRIRSRTTSLAMIKPPAGGTKAVLPGKSLRRMICASIESGDGSDLAQTLSGSSVE